MKNPQLYVIYVMMDITFMIQQLVFQEELHSVLLLSSMKCNQANGVRTHIS